MKKRVLLAVVASVVVLVSCGTSPLPPEELIIQEIFEVDKSKDELFHLSMEWAAKTFKSAKAVIQYEDKEEGIIVGKGFVVVRYGMGVPADTYFTLTIEVKDKKARATIEDAYFTVTMGTASSTTAVDNEATMSRFKPEVLKMFESLEAALKGEKEGW